MGGQKRNDGCGQHQHASENLAPGQCLIQQYPSADGGEDGFQTHDQRGKRGLGVFLADDLEGVAQRTGEHGNIENILPAGENAVDGGRLEEKGDGCSDQGGCAELYRTELDGIQRAAQAVDQRDVNGEDERSVIRSPEFTLAESVMHRK